MLFLQKEGNVNSPNFSQFHFLISQNLHLRKVLAKMFYLRQLLLIREIIKIKKMRVHDLYNNAVLLIMRYKQKTGVSYR